MPIQLYTNKRQSPEEMMRNLSLAIVDAGLEWFGRRHIKVHTRWWQVCKRSVAVHVPLLHLFLLEEIDFSQCLVQFFLQLLLLLVELLSCSSFCEEVRFENVRLRKKTCT